MTPETITDFLTCYIRSLSEETRHESKGPRHGFDHVIYELSLAENYVPVRLSFYRQGEDELSRPKKEAEHGVDQAFISLDGKYLIVFVLKDEVLNYRNWTAENFDTDLRRARDQDLSAPELANVKEVRIVLAYNKDDNEEGVESFDKFVHASGTKVGSNVALVFERWNLTTITEKVREKLLTPSLLPESFFKRFTYVCWQVGDFVHGSPQWREVLLPDWREFLTAVLAPPIKERSVRLVSVALIILRSHGKRDIAGEQDPSFASGWLDLLEWAALALWDAASRTDERSVKCAVSKIWLKFYLGEVERYYTEHIGLLAAEHSLEIGGGMLQEGASTYLAYWHMGRLGILAMAAGELAPQLDETTRTALHEIVAKTANWLIQLLNANPSCQRPLLDIHHIEIFLVWRALAQVGRWDDALAWFHSIFERLLYRRLGKAGCRVIDYGNSWESLFEYLATGDEPHAGFGKSSYLLLMVMEICLGAPDARGDAHADAIHRQLILGHNDDGPKLPFKETLELMGWIPSADWATRILAQQVNDGVSLPAHFTSDENGQSFPKALRRFIENSRKESPLKLIPGVPHSVFVLACLKHVSPLPSEMWRAALFGPVKTAKSDLEGTETPDTE